MGSSGSRPISEKNIVIVGGSYAGRAVASLLDAGFTVTWIERRPFLIHKMMVRSAVREDWIDAAFVPNDKILKRGKLVQGNVVSVDQEKKTLEYEGTDGSKHAIPFDYLVLATGATSVCPVEPTFSTLEESNADSIKRFFKETCATIGKHKDILVIGGGPVGCELAGEIKAAHPEARVTLANQTDTLCGSLKASQVNSDKLKAALEKCGVTVQLGQTIRNVPREGITEYTDPMDFSDSIKGITLVLKSTGNKPNTSFLPAELLNERHQIKVNEFLQVSDSVFAIGDCNDVAEPKLFTTAGTKKFMFGFPSGQADVAARNILAVEEKKPLAPYVPSSKKQAALIPIGDKHAVAFNAPAFFAKMKANDFFFPAQWKFANLKAPKVPKITK